MTTDPSDDPYRHDPPDTEFGAHLRKTAPDLPVRYRNPGRRSGQFRAPRSVPVGLGLGLVVIAGLVVLMWIGS